MYLFELFVFGTTRNLKSHRPDIIFSQSSGFVNSEIWGFFWLSEAEESKNCIVFQMSGKWVNGLLVFL